MSLEAGMDWKRYESTDRDGMCVCVCVWGDGWGGCIFGIRMTQFEFCDNDIRVSKKFLIGANQRPQKLEEERYRNEAYTHFSFFIRNLLSVVVLKVY